MCPGEHIGLMRIIYLDDTERTKESGDQEIATSELNPENELA